MSWKIPNHWVFTCRWWNFLTDRLVFRAFFARTLLTENTLIGYEKPGFFRQSVLLGCYYGIHWSKLSRNRMRWWSYLRVLLQLRLFIACNKRRNFKIGQIRTFISLCESEGNWRNLRWSFAGRVRFGMLIPFFKNLRTSWNKKHHCFSWQICFLSAAHLISHGAFSGATVFVLCLANKDKIRTLAE